MEILFEFISELLMEILVDTSKNKKMPKFVRILAGAIILLLFLFVFGLLLLCSFLTWKHSKFISVFFFALAILLLGKMIYGFKHKEK